MISQEVRRYCALIIDDPIFMSTKDNELLALRSKAQARLALMNFKGLGLDRPNFKDAFEGFQKVCNNSFSSSLSKAKAYACIAYMNLFGKGAEINWIKAKIGFQLVLNFPDIPSDLQADAHYWLGFMIYKKMETSLGDPSARTRFESVIKLAPKNSLWANAHYILGEMDFKKGRDERDPEAMKEARQHFILARPCLKERNQLRVDYTLALMDWLGYGIEEPNLQDAYEGFKKVAEQSDLDPELASKAEKYLEEINSLR